MSKVDLNRISSPCVRGRHDGCLAPASCECRCHSGAPVENTYDDTKAARVGIVWADPPRRWQPKRKPLLTDEQVALLKTRPGQFAQIRTYQSPSSAHNARRAWLDRPTDGESKDDWEIVARRFADGTSAIYVRYLGAAPCD